MTAQADGLLVHSSLVAKDGGFGQHAGIIDIAVFQNDLELFIQAGGVSLHTARAQGLHFADAFLQKIQAVLHIGLHLGTLGGAHFHKAIQRLCRNGRHIFPQLFLVHIRMAGGEHIRETGDYPGRDIIFDAQLLGDIPHGLLIAAGQFHVDRNHSICGIHILYSHAQLHLAAGDAFVELLFQSAVQIAAGARDARRILKVARIDAAQFHRDLPAIAHSSPTAKAGHA